MNFNPSKLLFLLVIFQFSMKADANYAEIKLMSNCKRDATADRPIAVNYGGEEKPLSSINLYIVNETDTDDWQDYFLRLNGTTLENDRWFLSNPMINDCQFNQDSDDFLTCDDSASAKFQKEVDETGKITYKVQMLFGNSGVEVSFDEKECTFDPNHGQPSSRDRTILFSRVLSPYQFGKIPKIKLKKTLSSVNPYKVLLSYEGATNAMEFASVRDNHDLWIVAKRWEFEGPIDLNIYKKEVQIDIDNDGDMDTLIVENATDQNLPVWQVVLLKNNTK